MGYPLRRLPVRGGSFWDNHNHGPKAGPEPWHNGEGVALHVANPGSILAHHVGFPGNCQMEFCLSGLE